MGEAKQKKAAREAALKSLEKCDIASVASALRRYLSACSPSMGADCYTYTALGQHLLSRLDVPADIAVGYAAWRVGNADHEVVGPFMDEEEE